MPLDVQSLYEDGFGHQFSGCLIAAGGSSGSVVFVIECSIYYLAKIFYLHAPVNFTRCERFAVKLGYVPSD